MHKRTFSRLLAAVLSGTLSLTAYAEDLLDVFQLAIEQDPGLRQAQFEQSATVELHRQSRAGLLPQANLGASTGRTEQKIGSISRSYDENGWRLSLSQPVYRYQNFQQYKQTAATVEQKAAELDAARQALMITVAERYFNVLGARDNLEFAESEKEATGRQLEQTKQRFEVGLIAITDVHEAQAAYDLTVANEINARNLLASAREALREVTTRFHDHLAPLADTIPLVPPDPADIDGWVEKALVHNAEIRAARLAAEAAFRAIRVAKGAHYPTLDLVANRTYTDNAGGRLANLEFTNTTIGLEINLNLYAGGGLQAQVQEAHLRWQQAKENLEAVRRAVQRQARDAYLSVTASISQVHALTQALVSNRSALAATEAGLEVGTRTTVDVLNVRRELFRAKRDYARARYDYVLNRLRLEQAAGTLGRDTLEEINHWLATQPTS